MISRLCGNAQLIGIVCGAMGGLSLSLGGLLVRMVSEETSSWQFLAWRSLAFALTMAVLGLARTGSPARFVRAIGDGGAAGMAIAVAIGIGQIGYVLGLIYTSVANVVFILGSAPLFAALAGWAVLGERLSTAALLALAAAMAGVGLIFVEGMGEGGVLGIGFAVLALVCYVSLVILLRRVRHLDTFAASSLGGVINLVICTAFAGGALFAPAGDVAIALVSGVFQVGAGFAFITFASRYIPAAEVTLLVLLETLCGPIWVWLAFAETPGVLTLGGGVIILGGVMAYALMSLARPDIEATG